ncbi:hypothetical protein BC835DRAFT_1413050 [Cytidiella melzeri]|nr:hypothetical protein BC835DRAFT_1413050 [Cytidiella melzeri]
MTFERKMGLSLVFSNDTVARVASRDNAGYDWQTTFYLVAQLISGDPQDQLSYYILTRKGIADIADNWRNRAHENGIKVGEESRFADDEDRALLPAPFLSTQRRARAFTQALPHVPALPLAPMSNPMQMSTPARAPRAQPFQLSPAFLNTPPPNQDLLKKFRLRGSNTDPAQTRRRPAFGQASDLCDIDEDEYMPYIEDFSSPAAITHLQSQTLPLHFHDPFDLSTLSDVYHDAQSLPALPPYESPRPSLYSTTKTLPACSVCGSSNGSLAVLDPCTHPLCSGCLTSALNIVGEKDMECAVCKAKVHDFKLQKLCIPNVEPAAKFQHQDMHSTFEKPLGSSSEPLDPGFQDFIDRAQGSSTPVPQVNIGRMAPGNVRLDERAVLRIDNVPWDITPPAISSWLKHPVDRVHVLLDRKGKTMSHAFVEMASSDAAKAALRTSQNSVLGKGKRARGLFPSWQGSFDGARPSLSGLENERVIAALQHGLISDAELRSLLHLIRSPDVPSLPYHSLISILSKFPSDEDSKVFWSGNLRDMLYENTHAAVTALVAKIDGNPFSEWTSLMTQVVRAAMDCQGVSNSVD